MLAIARDARLLAVALGGALMRVPRIVMLAAPQMIVGLYLDLAAPENQGTAVIAVIGGGGAAARPYEGEYPARRG